MRIAEIERNTKETQIKAKIDLDGSGKSQIDTGIGFFDHMLTAFAKHGFFDLELKCIGDLNVDDHHTIEDCGIVLGQCINKALGDKAGIERYGFYYVPLDEALVRTVMDISGRAYLRFDPRDATCRCGVMSIDMAEEFFRALAFNAGITLHIDVINAKNTHHCIEAMFKSFARALNMAVSYNEKQIGVPSTKGVL